MDPKFGHGLAISFHSSKNKDPKTTGRLWKLMKITFELDVIGSGINTPQASSNFGAVASTPSWIYKYISHHSTVFFFHFKIKKRQNFTERVEPIAQLCVCLSM